MYKNFLKRAVDIIAASAVLALISPVMLVIALLIAAEDGFPVFFRQTRIGRGGREFRMLKFRSMPVNTSNVPSHMAHTLKITRVGTFIRRTNLDELPQLVNIIKGDMSIVGPRPAIPSQTNLIRLREKSGVFSASPGLTGLAQVSSYNGMPEEVKVDFDARYCADITFLNDTKIVLRTISYLMKPPPVY